jgi:hypothetical protein
MWVPQPQQSVNPQKDGHPKRFAIYSNEQARHQRNARKTVY